VVEEREIISVSLLPRDRERKCYDCLVLKNEVDLERNERSGGDQSLFFTRAVKLKER